jgi:divinyl protochlorophyllide a 8-vinyl-reductase
LTPQTEARIGPNAVTRVAEAVRAQAGVRTAEALFQVAGLAHFLRAPPQEMVDEDDVVALHGALRGLLGPTAADAAAREAGLRTGDYLLTHRIPAPAQRLLRLLPPPLASRALLGAIRRHAWTFAGSGVFTATAGHPTLLRLENCPICRGVHSDAPTCGYFAATFERLFQALVSRHARVTETECAAMGAPACAFAVHWRDNRRPNGAG